MHVIGKFQKIVTYISGVGITVGVLVTFVMMLAITANVSARTILDVASLYVEEYSGYLLVLLSYFGFAYTLRTDGHISVDLIVRRLSPRVRRYVELITTAVCLATLCYLLPKSIHYTVFSYEMGVRSPWVSQSPMWIFHMFIPIGLAMFILQMLGHFVAILVAIVSKTDQKKLLSLAKTAGG